MPPETLVPILYALIAILGLGHIGGLLWSIILNRRVKLKTTRLLEELSRSESIRARLVEAAAEAELARSQAEQARSQAERARADAEAARAQAEEASRVKSRFLASVGHELRTPLHGIIGMSRLLERKNLNAEQAQLLGRIQSSSAQLFRSISDLLDISRADSGKLALSPKLFSLGEFGDWLSPLLQAEVEEKGLGYEFRLEGPPSAVRADRERIAQIVFNLVGNAVKFTTAGRVAVELRHGPGRLDIAVEDTGPGIAERERAHVFAPFYQGMSEEGHFRSGLGLGLSIVASLAEQMGGGVALDSELGKGSRFSVSLPVEEVEEGELAASPDLPLPREGRGRAGRRFLVAEDEGLNMLYITSLLELGGIGAREAEDGEAALKAFREDRYDLVLLDLGLPKLDGLEVSRAIRSLEAEEGRPRTPIVALTARAFPEDYAACREAGMDGFIAKPFAEEEFWAEIDRSFKAAQAESAESSSKLVGRDLGSEP